MKLTMGELISGLPVGSAKEIENGFGNVSLARVVQNWTKIFRGRCAAARVDDIALANCAGICLGRLWVEKRVTDGAAETQKRFAAIVEALGVESGVSVGQRGKKGFGSSALQINGKIFAKDSSAGRFVLKLPKSRVEALESCGVGQKFDPGQGCLMKEWLALDPKSG